MTRSTVSTNQMPFLNHTGARRARLVRALLALIAVGCLAAGIGGRVAAAPQHADAAKPAASEASPPPSQPPAPAGHEQPASAGHEPATAAGHAQAEAGAQHGEGGGEGEQHESPWALPARIVNFAILAGGLFYLLRSPLVSYLEQRGVTVRSDLTRAAQLKTEAAAQIADIDAKMHALPGEIEALKRRGAEEIKTEEARIQALAEAERRRLLDQAKREIDTQVRIAERDLKKRAGELAVELATARVKQTITERDHARLVERYVSQVRQ